MQHLLPLRLRGMDVEDEIAAGVRNLIVEVERDLEPDHGRRGGTRPALDDAVGDAGKAGRTRPLRGCRLRAGLRAGLRANLRANFRAVLRTEAEREFMKGSGWRGPYHSFVGSVCAPGLSRFFIGVWWSGRTRRRGLARGPGPGGPARQAEARCMCVWGWRRGAALRPPWRHTRHNTAGANRLGGAASMCTTRWKARLTAALRMAARCTRAT